MDIIDELLNENKWAEFLDYKLTKSHLNKKEEECLKDFVINKQYLNIAKSISQGTYTFTIPTKTLINKSGSSKKRAVYSFNYSENIVLKFISFCLYKYDYKFSPCTYAFRRNFTVKQAFIDLTRVNGIENMYSYKIDISNYFNSIDVGLLQTKLKYFLHEDTRLYSLLMSILTTNLSIHNGKVISESRGVMAGTPISTFLANVYLYDLDKYFSDNCITYARYSDDIIVFSDSLDKLNEYKAYILDYVASQNLTINIDKVELSKPSSEWTYLGFSYSNGVVDLSKVTLNKIKAKIRRKARSIYRWKVKNNKDVDHAIRVLIRVFNNKFYRVTNTKDLTWCKWFFPIITTANSLKQIDEHMLSYIRYMYSGRFKKQNYNVTYTKIKELGFRSLVNEYYKYRQGLFKGVK